MKLLVLNENEEYDLTPICAEQIELFSYCAGSPSSLSFNIAADLDAPELCEGMEVRLLDDELRGIFKGYIFSLSFDKEHIIRVKAYDQTRYLMNRDTYEYESIRADELIRMIAEDFNIEIGELANTGYLLPYTLEEENTLWNIIINALDCTYEITGKKYVLYDDFGRICLKAAGELMADGFSVADDMVIDFDYSSDIDKDTYNSVKVYKNTGVVGQQAVYRKKDSKNIKKWGVLQYNFHVTRNYSDAQMKYAAEKILKEKNKIRVDFSAECLGNVEVRAGCTVPVVLTDILNINDNMLVKECVHYFRNNEHIMKLVLQSFQEAG